MSYVMENIESLPTPCGEILITDPSGKRCRFSVQKSLFDIDYYLFEGTENEEAVNTDTNYKLVLETKDLVVGELYEIRLLGASLHYGTGDDHTEAVAGTACGYSIAIGAYDPNDYEKIDQLCDASRNCTGLEYDKSNFIEYDIEMLLDYSGFSFCLLDRSVDKIYFDVAWIKNEHEDSSAYESAVGFWTT